MKYNSLKIYYIIFFNFENMIIELFYKLYVYLYNFKLYLYLYYLYMIIKF